MLTGENFNSNDLQKSIKALPSHLIYLSPSRSAKDCDLRRVRGVPENLLFPLLSQTHQKAGVQRTQSFAGFGVSPKTPFSLSCRRRRPISKTQRSILSKSTGLTRHNYLHKKPSKLAVRNTKSKAILTTVQRKLPA